MKKRYFFVSYNLADDGFWGSVSIYGNALADTQNDNYFQLDYMEKSILESHKKAQEISDNSYVKILNIIELNEKDYSELNKNSDSISIH